MNLLPLLLSELPLVSSVDLTILTCFQKIRNGGIATWPEFTPNGQLLDSCCSCALGAAERPEPDEPDQAEQPADLT